MITYRLTLQKDNNFFYWINIKVFADDKLNVAKIMISVRDVIENILGQGENVGYKDFLLFLHCFQNVLSSWSLKLQIVWQRVNVFLVQLL